MPHERQRGALVRDLDRIVRRLAVSVQQHPQRAADLREEIRRLLGIMALADATRYVSVRVHRVPVGSDVRRFLAGMDAMDDERYRQRFRVTKAQFVHVLSRIEAHPIFHNESRNPQRPVRFQLAVALNRLGRCGNGASKGDTALHFRIGDGTVLLYTERVIEALLALEGEVIRWPDADERKEHAQFMDVTYRLKGCVGMVDGSCIVLATRPAVSGSDYFCRHRRYGVNITAIVDHRRVFRFTCVGWPASRHDNFVYEQTPVFQHPERYFSAFEYVIGDVAYTLSPNCMCPYKLPAANRRENAEFNLALSRGRVGVEHVFGLLKNRFMSLKGIPIQVCKADDFARINKWIRTCCVLHNMIKMFGDDEGEMNEVVDGHVVGGNGVAGVSVGSGRGFREILKGYVINK